MLKTAAAIASAAIIAGALTGYPEVVAGTSAGVQVVAAPTCPDRGWPYQHCGAGLVRMISTDRLN